MTLQRVLGVYMILAAAVVGVHFVISPLYDDAGSATAAWQIIDWFMAAAVLIALGATTTWKRALAGDADLKRYIEANVAFYGALWLTIWFFWNWFGFLVSRDEQVLWPFIDPLFVLVAGAVGYRLTCAPGGKE